MRLLTDTANELTSDWSKRGVRGQVMRQVTESAKEGHSFVVPWFYQSVAV
jgi:hypothetical protein